MTEASNPPARRRWHWAAIEFIYGQPARAQRLGRLLRYQLEPLHSARRGDRSVIHRIHGPRRRVMIERDGHRSDIYRTLS